MIIFEKPRDLARALLARDAKGILSLDGFPDVGKSTLARKLAEETGFAVVSTDVFMRPGREKFWTLLRYPDLKEHLAQVLARSRMAILDGCASIYVLRELGQEPCASIYVKRVAGSDGRWVHEPLIEAGKDARKLLEIQETSKLQGGMGFNYLHFDLVPYHLAEEPHLRSDFVFQQSF